MEMCGMVEFDALWPSDKKDCNFSNVSLEVELFVKWLNVRTSGHTW